MIRTFGVQIDSTTWPTPPQSPVFPVQFTSGSSSSTLDIQLLLLVIGLLTTPTYSTGVTLSDYWAWVRYINAISKSTNLEITKSFGEVDSHQKTILSDDFGMGVPMYWLTKTLDLTEICDGRYFVTYFAASLGITHSKSNKRGPNKSPDFVALDSNGLWHVVECKGTQSPPRYRESQFVNALKQKRSITFPSNLLGQRLACGLVIALEGSEFTSSLKIIDPEYHEIMEIRDNDLTLAREVMARSTLARVLRLSGYEDTSICVASPRGFAPTSIIGKEETENGQKNQIARRQTAARTELLNKAKIQFTRNKQQFFGRELILDLPQTFNVDGKTLRRIQIRQGINAKAIEGLASSPLDDSPITEFSPFLGQKRKIKLESNNNRAELSIGNLYSSRLTLI